MKNSRTSLNKPFYDWVKQVREADKKIVELEDKLYYYNVKLIGYKSPNFEPRLSSTKPEYKDNRYIWIDKITKITNEINDFKIKTLEYERMLSKLNPNEVKVLNSFVNKKYGNLNISRSYRYVILSNIAQKFNDFK